MKGHNILTALRSQLSAWTGRHRTGLITGVTCVLSISIVLLTALSAFHQREQATLEMEAALGGKRDIESLQALLVDANTEFLRGLGGASTASHAWPVSRTAGVARLYTELESDPRIEPRDIALIRDLRQLTANWTLQLESATSRTIPTGTSVAVDSALLLAANETLRGMTARLSTLRAHEDARVAAMSVESQRRLIRERFALVLAAVCAGVFLAYGFIANHRVSLARARNRIIAHEAEKRFDDYFDHHPLAMLIFDVHSLQILATNTAAQRQYGYSQQRFVDLRVSSLVADGSLAPFLSDTGRLDVAENRSGTAGVRTHRRADQTLIHAEVSYHFLRYASRDACFVVAIEVTEHEKAKLALRLRGRALDATLNAVLITRPSTHGDLVDYVNPAFERVTGYAREDVLNRDCAFMLCVDGERDSIATIREMFRSNRERTMLIFNQRRDGSRYWSQMHIAPVLDEQGHATHHITVLNDVSELVRSKDLLSIQARHDALTSLPNRFAFNAFLASALKNAHTGGTGVVLIFLDIDHFKDVNDSLGHDVGDCLLHEVAGRLSGCIRAGDMVARYGGDEFVLVLVDMEADGPLEDTLERIATAMDVPVTIDDVELNIEASIGIARFPQDAREPETLLKQADLAMYRAKQDGRNCARHFNPSLAQVCDERVGLSHRLRKALAGGGFTLHYQPQVALAEERISGVEALLRWVDPDLGNISPARFIPLAEENGLIVPIGEWVIGEACRQLKAWDRSLPGLRMSVNVSPRQFSRTNLPVLIERVLADTGLHPGRLELEITEGALMTPGALGTLQRLRAIGVTVAIDDFGTGYSSLAYVRNFRADGLKIDMSFVRGLGSSIEDESIVRMILGLGRALDIRVVAEGVETSGQRDFLMQHDCDEIQGYYYARPMPAADADRFISDFNSNRQCEAPPFWLRPTGS